MFLGAIITFLCYLDAIETFAIFFLYCHSLYLNAYQGKHKKEVRTKC